MPNNRLILPGNMAYMPLASSRTLISKRLPRGLGTFILDQDVDIHGLMRDRRPNEPVIAGRTFVGTYLRCRTNAGAKARKMRSHLVQVTRDIMRVLRDAGHLHRGFIAEGLGAFLWTGSSWRGWRAAPAHPALRSRCFCQTSGNEMAPGD